MARNVLITGANRGIGKALVKAFAENGDNVWACIRSENEEFNQYITETAKQNHVWIEPVMLDLSDPASIKKAFRTIAAEKKNVDILINCAGLGHMDLFQMTGMETIKNLYQVNVFALMQMCQLFLRIMIRQKQGIILNFASTASDEVYVGNCVYGSSKAAVVAFTKSLAAETAKDGIRVNAISPGLTDTEMSYIFDGKNAELPMNRSALGRKLFPQEVAQVVVTMTLDSMKMVNGQEIVVNGGAK